MRHRSWPVWVYYALVVVLLSLSSDITTLVTAATEEETTTTLLSNFDDVVGSRVRQLNVLGASIAFYDSVSASVQCSAVQCSAWFVNKRFFVNTVSL